MVDGSHDSRCVALLSGWNLDVENPHAPGSCILLSLVQAVTEVGNLIGLAGKLLMQLLILTCSSLEGSLQLRDLVREDGQFVQHLLLQLLHRLGGASLGGFAGRFALWPHDDGKARL